MPYETILCEREEKTCIITLNRPESLNALSFKMKEELLRLFDELEEDEGVGVVILTGGEKAFCAGADIKERVRTGGSIGQYDYYFSQRKSHGFYCRIEDFKKPVIAAVSGVAVGGGCELSLVCDFRIVADSARFGLPEVKLGMIPAAGGTQRLPRLIGVTKAKEMLYTGDFIDAEEAFRVGLVNKVVPVGELMREAKEMAQKLLKNPPLPMWFAKRAVNTGAHLDLAAALDYETHCAAMLSVSEDRKEGFAAFTEKRPPVFKGR